jgi:CHASE1-domain containing sensor protein
MTTKASPIANVHPPRLRLLGILPGVILICSVLFVLFYWHDLQDKATQKQQIEFNLQYERLLQSIANQLKANEEVLRGVVGLFDANHDVKLIEFRAYVEALNLQELHPGILGVGFSKMIEPQALDNHIKSMRAAGFPDYSVFPAGQRDIYTSIIYLEPFNWRNQRAFGYDM